MAESGRSASQVSNLDDLLANESTRPAGTAADVTAFMRTYGVDHLLLAVAEVLMARRHERKGHPKLAKYRLISAGMHIQSAGDKLMQNAVAPRIARRVVQARIARTLG